MWASTLLFGRSPTNTSANHSFQRKRGWTEVLILRSCLLFFGVVSCSFEPNFSPIRLRVFGAEQRFGIETTAMKAVKDDARIFQFQHVSGLFIDNLAHAAFHL